ncbi:indolepyruvate ferredoxin oxidoreductase subunit alpha [Tissierella pigra]|uniref:Indolepyruvate oxidoreductase subunit IorA n=1 Tax=Tissierella pigra TaxID=2607614 RepID=A0A6N7XZS9_9FIRM|nr:indolepyruvate ferredoxin oxidoreductase subunit alpha [Tissierella pigra]MBU5428119.1 indolepyruvate ferredoxin oxidoreductase subunit alpha [Tissierella pigra]MSU01975.1 indolepyruvate ferredoxin oxidoreductase subunit alpha [Tissierella pigra]
MKKLMTGNEAVAQGAYEAGISYASAYPGTPSTEILENIALFKDNIISEWAPNEKVALETAIGASIAGARSLCAMKMVGVNVAADPLFTYAYMGVNGALILISADDPGMASSQNEQDNRHYAKFAKIAMLEPSDSQECKDMIKSAVEISEKYDTTVLFRMTQRVCHSKSLVQLGEKVEAPIKDYAKNNAKFDAMPVYSRALRYKLEDRLKKLEEFSNETDLNFIEWNNSKIGIVTSGVSYQYAKEVFSNKASYLKLGFTYPLPMKKIKDFASKVDTLYVIEELEPYIEEQLKANGINCIGKEKIPNIGELNTDIVAKSLLEIEKELIETAEEKVVNRPPTLCAGCPHRGFFYELGKFKNVMVAGDIGCYGLGGSEPLKAKDTCICMGGSVGTAHGVQKVFDKFGKEMRTVATMGDSTFFHTGINGLIGTLYNGGKVITCILDNRTTGMTGHQENPGTGFTLEGEVSADIDIETVVRALGCKNVRTINPHRLEEVREALQWALSLEEPSVIITRYPCVLKKYSDADKEEFGVLKDKYFVKKDLCIGCKICIKTGCPAIRFNNIEKKSFIMESQCVGCSVCSQVCPKDAIVRR